MISFFLLYRSLLWWGREALNWKKYFFVLKFMSMTYHVEPSNKFSHRNRGKIYKRNIYEMYPLKSNWSMKKFDFCSDSCQWIREVRQSALTDMTLAFKDWTQNVLMFLMMMLRDVDESWSSVEILNLNFGKDFEVNFWSLWACDMVKILKVKFDRDFEGSLVKYMRLKFGQDFEAD